MIETWSGILQSSFNDVWNGFASFVPNFVAAVVIFLVGWVIAVFLGKIVSQIIKSIKLDSLLRSARVDELTKRANWNLDSGAFLGGLTRWFFIIVFLIAAFDALGLTQVTVFLQTIAAYLPDVFAAVLILVAGVLIAEFLHKVVLGAAQAANIRSANFLATVSQWVIWIFAVLMALFQLRIAAPFVQTLFTGVVIALAIGFGLAFGLGGQDAAARFIDKIKQGIANR